ncbi:Protein vip1 [Coemansia thaxteri]|uniref:Protein vip1 n=1 Tax=Coemansia thaxteri TaxID=2663907 RepID=A0A9W8BJX3_9FUNG|nr:Protein vip1 [Coemansia thaxteri]KAJ2004640.1 Protein vip1 [Coemansia thaxteri]
MDTAMNWKTELPSTPDPSYIVVENIALSATETNVRDFFAFCGPIEVLELQKLDSGTQRALIKFGTSDAADTSLLLSNALINYEPIHVSSLFPKSQPAHAGEEASRNASDSQPSDYKDKPALYVVHELLAAGYMVGEHVVARASAFDAEHRVSDRTKEQARSLDRQYKFSNYLQQWDDKFNITKRAKEAYDKFQSHPVGQKVVLTVNDAYQSALQLSEEARKHAERKRAQDEQLFGKIPLPPAPKPSTSAGAGASGTAGSNVGNTDTGLPTARRESPTDHEKK